MTKEWAIGGSMGGNTNWMCNSRSHHHHRRPRTWPLHYSFLDDVRVETKSPAAATNGSGSGPTISGLIKEEDRGRDQKSKKTFQWRVTSSVGPIRFQPVLSVPATWSRSYSLSVSLCYFFPDGWLRLSMWVPGLDVGSFS